MFQTKLIINMANKLLNNMKNKPHQMFKKYARAGLIAIISYSVIITSSFASDSSPSQMTIIKAAAYVDVNSGELIRPAVLLIDKGRIAAINPATLPATANIVDLGDRTLLPGLIDVHTHLMMSTNNVTELVRQAKEYTEADFSITTVKNGYKTLMAGFTTVRDLHSWYFVDVTLSKRSEEPGMAVPRIIPGGHGLMVSGPADYSHFFAGVTSLPEVGIADTAAQLIEAVDFQAANGAKVIKLYGTTGFTMSAYSDVPVGSPTYSQELIAVVVKRAAKHGMKVATHAHGSAGIMASVKGGVASIEHGSELTDDIISEMKARGTFLVPTTNSMNSASLKDPNQPPKAAEIVRQAIKSHKRAIKAGLKIGYGTDAGLYPHGKNADGFADLVEYGMTPAEALRTATSNAAELLGVSDRGSIEVGKLADIIAVSGNPLKEINLLKSVNFVMKDGTIFKNQGK
jgi:imidazolonepropionase-like amidohydrolase